MTQHAEISRDRAVWGHFLVPRWPGVFRLFFSQAAGLSERTLALCTASMGWHVS